MECRPGLRCSSAHILHTRRAGRNPAERRDRAIRRQGSTQRRRCSGRCCTCRTRRPRRATTTSRIGPQPRRPTGARLADRVAAGRHVPARVRGDRAGVRVRQRPREPAPTVDILWLRLECAPPAAGEHPHHHQRFALLV